MRNLFEIDDPESTNKLWVEAAAQPEKKFDALIDEGDLSLSQPAVVVFHGNSCTVIVRPPTTDDIISIMEKCQNHDVVNVGLVDRALVLKAVYDNDIRQAS